MGSNAVLWPGGPESSHVLPAFRRSSGKLRQLLGKGEFAAFKHMPMFEGDFVQISEKGEVVDVHNSVQMVTVGIAYTSPGLTIPDIMLLARVPVSCAVCARQHLHARGRGLKSAKSLELTRLLPLKFVKLSVYSHERKQLHLELATGNSFYLQFWPPAGAEEDLFAHWEDLVFFLRPPVEAYSGTQAVPVCDVTEVPVLEAEDGRSPAAMELDGEGDQDEVSIRSLPMVDEVSGATSFAYAGGEETQQDASHRRAVLTDISSFLTPAPAGPAQGAIPAAAVTPKGSVSVVAGGEVTSKPVTETLEGPGPRSFVPACQGEDNLRELNGDQGASQHQAVACSKRKKKEKTTTKRPSQSGRKREDKSSLRSQGIIQEDQGLGSSPSGIQQPGRQPKGVETTSETREKLIEN